MNGLCRTQERVSLPDADFEAIFVCAIPNMQTLIALCIVRDVLSIRVRPTDMVDNRPTSPTLSCQVEAEEL